MRPLIAVAVIIAVLVTLVLLGVGQGETACVQECQTQQCKNPHTPAMDCAGDAFRECAQACRAAAD